MVRQILLTSPGERADLPEFGCGLRQLLFAPNSDALQAATQLLIQRSLSLWLSDQIAVQTITVGPGPDGDYSQIVVQVAYTLLETQSMQQTSVLVS
jgi:phage baseplate assembly protein W